MARVQYGGIITDIAGSIGGITFQSNAAAKIARLKSTRRKQNTPKQNTRLNDFQLNIPGWAALDQNEKDAWTTFALAHNKTNKWGEVKSLTGFNWFMSINNYLNIVGETPLSAPPVWAPPTNVAAYDVSAVFNDFSINFQAPFTHNNSYCLLFTSPLLRTVSQANRKVLRLTQIGAPGTSTTIDFLAAWQTTHGIAVPIACSPYKKFIFTEILTFHETKGIS